MSARPDIKSAQAPSRAVHTDEVTRRMLRHELRHQILIRTGERPWCPSEISKETGEPLKRVCEHIAVLLAQSPPYLELVEERQGPKGGAPQHFYRALVRVNVDLKAWSKMTLHEKAQQTVTITEQVHGEWAASIESGAFYADDHHHLSRLAMTVDAEGMRQVDELFNQISPLLAEIEREAAERRSETGSDAIRLITLRSSFRAAP